MLFRSFIINFRLYKFQITILKWSIFPLDDFSSTFCFPVFIVDYKIKNSKCKLIKCYYSKLVGDCRYVWFVTGDVSCHGNKRATSTRRNAMHKASKINIATVRTCHSTWRAGLFDVDGNTHRLKFAPATRRGVAQPCVRTSKHCDRYSDS